MDEMIITKDETGTIRAAPPQRWRTGPNDRRKNRGPVAIQDYLGAHAKISENDGSGEDRKRAPQPVRQAPRCLALT
jgi:hypothetical protein